MTVHGEVRTALPTGVVTFLLTDVEDSTRLWETAPTAMGPAIARQYAILDECIERHGGVRPLEQGEGDSVVAVFVRPAAAVAAAFDAQLAMRAEPWPSAAALRVRMAVHTGEAQLRDAWNYVGPAIIRCARLRGLAAGGQIVVSRTTRELTQGALPGGAALADLGERALKGIDAPERVYGLLHPALGGGWDLAPPSHNLPRAFTPFVGRDEELERIGEAIERAPLVTLTGPGGAGKTRLALEVAGRRLGRHPDGVFVVELAQIADGALLPRHALGALGVAEEASRPASDTLAEHLRDRACLLVLDNAEHVIEDVAPAVDALLRRCRELRILATSREPLDIAGEHVWAVDGLAGDDALALFAERAAQARAGFALDATTAPLIERVCRALGGMPLAIELAAARLRQLPLDVVADGLGSSLDLLSHGPRTAVERHRTLRASLDWSHDLLSEDERVLYRRFAVFAGGATLDAVRRVCGREPLRETDVVELLAALVDKSLVRLDDDATTARYRMLEPVRQHAGELLDATDGASIRDAHLALALELADAVAAQDELDPLLPRIEEELANLRAAVEHALITDPSRAVRLTAALGRFWVFGGHIREGLALLRRVLDAGADAPPAELAHVLTAAATLSQFLAEHESAFALAQQALETAESSGDGRAIGRAAHALSAIIGPLEPQQGVALSERSVDLLRDAASAGDLAWSLIGLGLNRSWLNDFAGAAAATDEAITLTGDRAIAAWREVVELWRLVDVGELDAAELGGRRGQAVSARRVPMVDDILAQALLSVYVWRGEAVTVLRGAEAAVDRTEAESPLATSALQSVLALADLAVGDLAALRRRAAILDGGWLRYHEAETLGILALGELTAGNLEEAGRRAEGMRAIGRQFGNQRFPALADIIDGRIALERRRVEDARAALHRALGVIAEHGWRLRLPPVLEALGAVAAEEEDWPVAARLLAAGRTGYGEIGSVRIPASPEHWDALRDMAVAAAPDAWTEGEAMSLDDAVAYARRGRGPRERPLRGWAALTPTEAEVAALAAAGRTNPQIAEELFMSRATVKRHLARAFEKLGVSGRTELAAKAATRAS